MEVTWVRDDGTRVRSAAYYSYRRDPLGEWMVGDTPLREIKGAVFAKYSNYYEYTRTFNRSNGARAMSEMIERVAKVIADARVAWERPSGDLWAYVARAAVEAMREPTAEMIRDGMIACATSIEGQTATRLQAERCYRAMIDTALSARSAGVEVDTETPSTP